VPGPVQHLGGLAGSRTWHGSVLLACGSHGGATNGGLPSIVAGIGRWRKHRGSDAKLARHGGGAGSSPWGWVIDEVVKSVMGSGGGGASMNNGGCGKLLLLKEISKEEHGRVVLIEAMAERRFFDKIWQG
jgi:hypothetical protein